MLALPAVSRARYAHSSIALSVPWPCLDASTMVPSERPRRNSVIASTMSMSVVSHEVNHVSPVRSFIVTIFSPSCGTHSSGAERYMPSIMHIDEVPGSIGRLPSRTNEEPATGSDMAESSICTRSDGISVTLPVSASSIPYRFPSTSISLGHSLKKTSPAVATVRVSIILYRPSSMTSYA